MINPVDGTASAYLYSPTAESSSKKSSSSLASETGDVVTISSDGMKAQLENMEALRAAQEKEDAENPGSKWRLTSGFKEGTFALDNGNQQKVSIDGDKLEILEFQNGRLVKSVKGTITADGASLDTEYYDKSGDITQAIHTDIVELPGADGWSAASMSRSAKWFEGGKLKGEIQDSMLLSSWNSGVKEKGEDGAGHIMSLLNKGTDKVVTSVEAVTSSITLEKHIASYHADIHEYGENSRVAREVVIDHEGRFKQMSNRSNKEMGNMAERGTRELEHKTDLSISIRDYDEDGNLIRDAMFRDTQKDNADKESDGRLEQSVSVSWYNKGELVKRSYGSLSKAETEGHKLRERPGILDTLGLSVGGYLGSEPQSAVDLLSKQYLQSSSEPEFFMDSINRVAGANAYSTAKDVAANGNPNQPYSIDWTDELYREGEMVMRQRDMERARETTYEQRYRRVHFQTGLRNSQSLTENDVPTVVRETSHEREDYENGRLKSRQSVSARESVDQQANRPDQLVTNAVMTQGLAGKETTTAMKVDGGLTMVDPDPNAAAKGISVQMELTLDDMRKTTTNMNEGEVSKRDALHVRFDYKHFWD